MSLAQATDDLLGCVQDKRPPECFVLRGELLKQFDELDRRVWVEACRSGFEGKLPRPTAAGHWNYHGKTNLPGVVFRGFRVAPAYVIQSWRNDLLALRDLAAALNNNQGGTGQAKGAAGSGTLAEPPAETQGQQVPAGMPWTEAADRLKRLREQGDLYTSQHKLADQLGCSPATINKAIDNTPDLRAWAKKPEASPKAQSLNEVVTDRTAQHREPNPEDDAAIREFIEKADPQTKAWFHALPSEEQIEVVNDPDKHRKILGRKP
jgi:hypothetical protein